ncbi:MAG: hypothetical protein J1F16_09545 [Muribaculaceae bacterium]|nr:hypothetical protein [Muribaculaceae bacterium]
MSREDKKLSAPTAEELFMQQVEAVPLKDWNEGKRFVASDNKALLVVVPRQGLLPVAPDSVKGKVLEFCGIESKINAAGSLTVTLIFSDGIYIYSYDTAKEFNDAMETVKSDQIPMLIDEDMVNQARQLLLGKKLWNRSPLWYDKEGNRIDGKKFVEVTITDIQPGNLIFPLQVEIETDNKEKAYVYMNFGSADNESRSFNNIFSFTDIRKHYPGIDNATWDLISQGKVKPGMTKEEVKLSLGNPSDLNSGHDYSQTLDIWTYDNGKVLWFEDGRLVRIRQ